MPPPSHHFCQIVSTILFWGRLFPPKKSEKMSEYLLVFSNGGSIFFDSSHFQASPFTNAGNSTPLYKSSSYFSGGGDPTRSQRNERTSANLKIVRVSEFANPHTGIRAKKRQIRPQIPKMPPTSILQCPEFATPKKCAKYILVRLKNMFFAILCREAKKLGA